MRLTGGEGKGRRLIAPPEFVRPTSSRIRESLFSILNSNSVLEDATVLDLFAGSGVLGLESLARGANSVVFVDKNHRSVKVIQKNIEICSVKDQSTVFCDDAVKWLSSPKRGDRTFSLVFADPPYALDILQPLCKNLADYSVLEPGGLFIFEAASRSDILIPDNWTLDQKRVFGDTALYFLTP